MSGILNMLNFLLSVYMLVLSFRIILSWFSGMGTSSIQGYLAVITDPYLNWFRRFTFLQVGKLDLSPIAALGVLSLLNRIVSMLARFGRITIGIILAMILQTIWGAFSFLLGFIIVVLILRLVSLYLSRGGGHPFWNVVDTISQPVIYRVNRILFKNRIVNYLTALVVSIACLGLIYFALRIFVSVFFRLFLRLPF